MVKLIRRIRQTLQANAIERARQKTIATRNAKSQQPDGPITATLARIIGNDLFPRHADGQAMRNLDFILNEEPDFPGCRKVFVLNRLFDRDAAAAAAERIRARGHDVIDLPFVAAEYAATALDTAFIAETVDKAVDVLSGYDLYKTQRAQLWALRNKLNYAMNINGARNAALAYAKANSDWGFILDGSCFVTAKAWQGFSADMRNCPFAPYLIIPMQRLTRNEGLEDVAFDLKSLEEPQIALHRTALLGFDVRFPYGLRDKTALFSELGVPGAWNNWAHVPFLPDVTTSADRWYFKYASAPVFRLSSGVSGGQLEKVGAQKQRHNARNEAIFATIAMLDQEHSSPDAAIVRRFLGLN